MELEEVKLFFAYLGAEKGSSPQTVSAYRGDLAKFFSWLNILNKSWQDVNSDIVGNYLVFLSEQMTLISVRRHAASLHHFFRFLCSENFLEHDPFIGVFLPAYERSLPQVLNPQQVERLLTTARDEAIDPLGIRLYCCLELLYASGVRVSELLSLSVSAIDGQKDYFSVRGKGNKERLVPLHEFAKSAVLSYLDVRSRFIQSPRSALFLFPSGSGHLTRQRLGQLIKGLAKRADLPTSDVSPHALRHAFASHLLARGLSLRYIQDLLGHKNITTTQIYTQVSFGSLCKVLQVCHPLAQAGKTLDNFGAVL